MRLWDTAYRWNFSSHKVPNENLPITAALFSPPPSPKPISSSFESNNEDFQSYSARVAVL
jgi:hypothetical protein